jgi:hypothetical protein
MTPPPYKYMGAKKIVLEGEILQDPTFKDIH